MDKIYYDDDADLRYLNNKVVGVIGYGIQGRAQALNLRDSGIKVLIGNRNDEYAERARRDGFEVHSIDNVAKGSDFLLFLIPDQAQSEIYKKHIQNSLRKGGMLVFAHGYALRYRSIDLSPEVDVAMLAPRMPGYQIRDRFLKGGGVPAFVDIIQDRSGTARQNLLSLSKAIGFTRAGVLEVSYKVETELDLFTEQFLVAGILKIIHIAFKILVEELDYPPVPTLMELYASGELSEVLSLASTMGIGKAFQKNASPTCQYGIASNFDIIDENSLKKKAKEIIECICNGTFAKALEKEGKGGYPKVRDLWETIDNIRISDAQEWINGHFKRPELHK